MAPDRGLHLFQKDRDYQAFERLLGEAIREQPIRLFGYRLVPNHWHMLCRINVFTVMARWSASVSFS